MRPGPLAHPDAHRTFHRFRIEIDAAASQSRRPARGAWIGDRSARSPIFVVFYDKLNGVTRFNAISSLGTSACLARIIHEQRPRVTRHFEQRACPERSRMGREISPMAGFPNARCLDGVFPRHAAERSRRARHDEHRQWWHPDERTPCLACSTHVIHWNRNFSRRVRRPWRHRPARRACHRRAAEDQVPPRSSPSSVIRTRQPRSPARVCRFVLPHIPTRLRSNMPSKAVGVAHIIYTSAPHADTWSLVLAPDHKATEEAIIQSGIPYTILRNNWYTENYVSAVELPRQSGEVVAASGSGRIASASRADFAAGAAAARTGEGHEGKTYELSGDVPRDFNDLAAAISEIIGRPVTYSAVTPDELISTLTGQGLPEGTARFVAALDANVADGLRGDASDDLQWLIGRPTTPLLDGLYSCGRFLIPPASAQRILPRRVRLAAGNNSELPRSRVAFPQV